MGNAIRVLVANRPKLMRDLIVSIVAEQPDMELVGEVSEEEEVDIAERIRQAKGGAGPDEASSIGTDADELQMAGFFVIDQQGRKK